MGGLFYINLRGFQSFTKHQSEQGLGVTRGCWGQALTLLGGGTVGAGSASSPLSWWGSQCRILFRGVCGIGAQQKGIRVSQMWPHPPGDEFLKEGSLGCSPRPAGCLWGVPGVQHFLLQDMGWGWVSLQDTVERGGESWDAGSVPEGVEGGGVP